MHEFDVNNQIITRTDKTKIVNYSDDYLRLCFNFRTSDWTGTAKFILVYSGENVYRVALTDDKFIVPEELLTTQKLVFSVYGTTASYRITTPKILLHLLIAGYDEHTSELNVDEFTNDVVEQIYVKFTDYYTKTEVDALLHAKDNQVIVEADKPVIQTGETAV